MERSYTVFVVVVLILICLFCLFGMDEFDIQRTVLRDIFL
jgi:hypothetical protein